MTDMGPGNGLPAVPLEAFSLPAGDPRLRQLGERPVWRYVIKLLRLQWLIFASGFRRARRGQKVMRIFLLVLALAFAGFLLFASYGLLWFLRSPMFAEVVGDTQSLVDSVPVLVLGMAFLMLLLTSFGVLLQGLYLSGDMEFLLAAPVPVRSVFIAKLLQAVLPNFGLLALIGMPLLFGLGAAEGYNLLYYPMVGVVMACLALAGAGLAALLVMGVVRIFPARRVAEVLAFLGAIISITCSQLGNLANFSGNRLDNLDQAEVGTRLAGLARLNTPWSPLAWPGRGLAALGEGDWLAGLGLTTLTLAVCAAIFWLSLSTAQKLYYSGWSSMQVGGRKKKNVVRRGTSTAAGPLSTHSGQPGGGISGVIMRQAAFVGKVLPQPVRGILVKDLLVLRRDLRNMSQAITPILFGLIYGFMLLRTGGEAPAGRGEAPDWFMQALEAGIAYGGVLIAMFVSWGMLSRLALTGFSQEGKSYWILKASPVRPRHLVAAKFLVAYLPSLAFGTLFLLVMGLVQRTSWGVLGYGLAVLVLASTGTCGINLAFGIKGANLDWDNPKHMTSGTTGCLSSLVSFVVTPLGLALFFVPPIMLPALGVPALAAQGLGLLLGGVFNLALAVFPVWLVRRSIGQLGEKTA